MTAPLGRPKASAAGASHALQSGVSSGVLITQALPVARAADKDRAVYVGDIGKSLFWQFFPVPGLNTLIRPAPPSTHVPSMKFCQYVIIWV